jgi:hypothetical protein
MAVLLLMNDQNEGFFPPKSMDFTAVDVTRGFGNFSLPEDAIPFKPTYRRWLGWLGAVLIASFTCVLPRNSFLHRVG